MKTNVIFQFNDVGKPYLLLKKEDENRTIRLGGIEFNPNDLEDGLPKYDDLIITIDNFLSSKNIARDSVSIILNCKKTTKLTVVVPNVGDRKTKKIYETELLNRLPDLDKYDRYSTSSDVSNGKAYYDFVTDKKYREYFERFAHDLGFENVECDYLYSDLYKKISEQHNGESYVYVFEEKDVASLLVVVKGILCAYSSFESNDDNYRLNIASIVDNHVYNLEKENLTKFISNKDIKQLEDIKTYLKTYKVGE